MSPNVIPVGSKSQYCDLERKIGTQLMFNAILHSLVSIPLKPIPICTFEERDIIKQMRSLVYMDKI